MKRQYFGTDGIRTKVPGSFLDSEFTEKLGYAIATYLHKHGQSQKPFLLARDTRTSGLELLNGLLKGLGKGGVVCIDLGVYPTPSLSSIVREMGAAGGAMITASHNPATDNGIKLFQSTGEKWQDEQEFELEALLSEAEPNGHAPVAAQQLESERLQTLFHSSYQRFRTSQFANLRIVVDAARGATCQLGPKLFESLGIEAQWRFTDPDGTNINQDCGSEHPKSLSEIVRDSQAQLGLALDGDGDRLVIVNGRGEVVPGDQLLGILIQALTTKEQPDVVITEQSNYGLETWLRQQGRQVWRTPVGDRYVWREMKQRSILFGGENSGHFLYSSHLPCSDGLGFSLFLLEFLANSPYTLEEWQQQIPLLPSLSRNIMLTSKPPLEEISGFQEVVKRVRKQIGEDGRLLVRYSGTEPKIRLLIEFKKPAPIESFMKELESGVREFLPIAPTG